MLSSAAVGRCGEDRFGHLEVDGDWLRGKRKQLQRQRTLIEYSE